MSASSNHHRFKIDLSSMVLPHERKASPAQQPQYQQQPHALGPVVTSTTSTSPANHHHTLTTPSAAAAAAATGTVRPAPTQQQSSSSTTSSSSSSAAAAAAAVAAGGGGHHQRLNAYALAEREEAQRAAAAAASLATGGGTNSGRRKQQSSQQRSSGGIRLNDWEIVETLGTGTFGRVLLVRPRPGWRRVSRHPIFPELNVLPPPPPPPPPPGGSNGNGESTERSGPTPTPEEEARADAQLPHYAMKVLAKADVVKLKQVEHINSERAILERVRHPFLVELYATYQDDLNVYMLLSYVPGGELFSHLRRAGRFTADVTRFYMASIILAIKYLHDQEIVYRDLKPENLLLDRDGYLKIADFGFAKSVAESERCYTTCGTPEFLAPELITGKGHGLSVDWWALGCLCFEMLAGYPAFFAETPLQTYEKILAGKIAFPAIIDPSAKSLIRGLLQADLSKRLGNLRNGAHDVMNHAWFAGCPFGELERRQIRAPIIPYLATPGDSSNFQRYAPPLPESLPGMLGHPRGTYPDPHGHLFADFRFPGDEA